MTEESDQQQAATSVSRDGLAAIAILLVTIAVITFVVVSLV